MGKTYEFIVNLHSRTGKAEEIWRGLEQILIDEKVDYRVHVTQYVHHGIEIARDLTADGEEHFLVVGGGDGTINEVLNGICDLSKVTFGYLPLGSANDFARGLGVNAEPETILRAILASDATEAIDIGEVICGEDTRRFVISAGAGIDAAVCREALTSKLKAFLNRFHLGSLTYGMLTVVKLFRAPFISGTVAMEDGREIFMKRIIFAAAMNFPYEGGGVPMAPRANATDGKLSACLVYGIPHFLCFLAFPFLLAGKHEKIRGFEIVDAEEFRVHFDAPMVVHADGEDCGDQADVIFRCAPHALVMPRLKISV